MGQVVSLSHVEAHPPATNPDRDSIDRVLATLRGEAERGGITDELSCMWDCLTDELREEFFSDLNPCDGSTEGEA